MQTSKHNYFEGNKKVDRSAKPASFYKSKQRKEEKKERQQKRREKVEDYNRVVAFETSYI